MDLVSPTWLESFLRDCASLHLKLQSLVSCFRLHRAKKKKIIRPCFFPVRLHVWQRYLFCGYGVKICQLLRYFEKQSRRSFATLRCCTGQLVCYLSAPNINNSFDHFDRFSYERKEADYIEKLKKDYQSVLGVGKTQPNPEESKVISAI